MHEKIFKQAIVLLNLFIMHVSLFSALFHVIDHQIRKINSLVDGKFFLELFQVNLHPVLHVCEFNFSRYDLLISILLFINQYQREFVACAYCFVHSEMVLIRWLSDVVCFYIYSFLNFTFNTFSTTADIVTVM